MRTRLAVYGFVLLLATGLGAAAGSGESEGCAASVGDCDLMFLDAIDEAFVSFAVCVVAILVLEGVVALVGRGDEARRLSEAEDEDGP